MKKTSYWSLTAILASSLACAPDPEKKDLREKLAPEHEPISEQEGFRPTNTEISPEVSPTVDEKDPASPSASSDSDSGASAAYASLGQMNGLQVYAIIGAVGNARETLYLTVVEDRATTPVIERMPVEKVSANRWESSFFLNGDEDYEVMLSFAVLGGGKCSFTYSYIGSGSLIDMPAPHDNPSLYIRDNCPELE